MMEDEMDFVLTPGHIMNCALASGLIDVRYFLAYYCNYITWEEAKEEIGRRYDLQQWI